MVGVVKRSKQLQVLNKAGFHLRVASMISRTATDFVSEIFLVNGSYRADCKSCIDLLAVMAPCGTILTLEVEGPDAAECEKVFSDLFGKKFGEDEFATAG